MSFLDGFVVKRDEGRAKETETTGAQRDNQDGKYRFDLIGLHMLKRLSLLLARGALKYSERNWEKGQSVSRTYASLLRHTFAYFEGDRTEDHLASIVFNAMSIMHVEGEVENGKLPRELLDFQFYDELPEFNEQTAANQVSGGFAELLQTVYNYYGTRDAMLHDESNDGSEEISDYDYEVSYPESDDDQDSDYLSSSADYSTE